MAQVESLLAELRKRHKNIDVSLLSFYPLCDEQFAPALNIKVIRFCSVSSVAIARWHFLFLLISGWMLSLFHIKKHPLIKTINEYDNIFDLSGDSFRKPPGGKDLVHFLLYAIIVRLKKPLIIFSQSIGPFSKLGQFFFKKISSKMTFCPRDEKSISYITHLNPDINIQKTSDIAFKLYADKGVFYHNFINNNNIDLQKPIVGMSVSSLTYRLYPNFYPEVLEKTISFLEQKQIEQVVIVPHEYFYPYSKVDDFIWAQEWLNKVAPTTPIKMSIIPVNPKASEIKGIVSDCCFFIAARMHAGIAAISSNVPTVFQSWSFKYKGLLKPYELDWLSYELNSYNSEEYTKILDKAWKQKANITHRLTEMNQVKHQEIDKCMNKICSELLTH